MKSLYCRLRKRFREAFENLRIFCCNSRFKARKAEFFFNFKQLLDEVLVISRIIKVEVSVFSRSRSRSRSRRLRLIILTVFCLYNFEYEMSMCHLVQEITPLSGGLRCMCDAPWSKCNVIKCEITRKLNFSSKISKTRIATNRHLKNQFWL